MIIISPYKTDQAQGTGNVEQHIQNWRMVFDEASIKQKELMLCTIISRVDVYRDWIKVHFKMKISQFIGTMGVEVGADKVIE